MDLSPSDLEPEIILLPWVVPKQPIAGEVQLDNDPAVGTKAAKASEAEPGAAKAPKAKRYWRCGHCSARIQENKRKHDEGYHPGKTPSWTRVSAGMFVLHKTIVYWAVWCGTVVMVHYLSLNTNILKTVY